jgi:tRNA pseudouridine55 synthase
LSLLADLRGGAVYLLDKPAGMTSRAASGLVARAWGPLKRHGHAGTLDPSASGVLPVLLGKATRLSRWLTGHTKRYRFTLVLGASTDTGDDEGRVTATGDPSGVTRDMVVGALPALTGRFGQRVPEFSAVRIDGIRAYELARSGRPGEMPVRMVETHDWTAGDLEGGCIELEVTAGPGTYIRALARDIGGALGCPAHARRITRTAMGGFRLEMCSCEPGDPEALVSMACAMAGFPGLEMDDAEAAMIMRGNAIERMSEGVVALLHEGALIAVGEGSGNLVRPVAVLG